MRTSFSFVSRSIALPLLAFAVACDDDPSRSVFNPPTTVSVDPTGGGDFTTIQAAVDGATPGSTIRVSAGMYVEQVVVDKQLTIVGSSGATLLQAQGTPTAFPDDTTDDSSAVLVIRNASGVILEGLSLSGPQDGLQIRDASNITIIGVDASGNGDEGVDIRNSTDVSVSGRFDGNGDQGVLVRDNSTAVRITTCRISGNANTGLRIRESSNGTVESCTVSQNLDDGIEVRDSSSVTLTANTVTDNLGYGVRIRNSPDTVEQDNTISGNAQGDVRRD